MKHKEQTSLTFLTDSLRAGEACGWSRSLSWGQEAISFWRKRRWFLSLETHSSNSSADFTWSRRRRWEADEGDAGGVRWNSIERLYLQMEDVILGIQVDAHGFLLDGHDGEAHIDAAMELSLFQLRETGSEWVYLSTRGPKKKLKWVWPTSAALLVYLRKPLCSRKYLWAEGQQKGRWLSSAWEHNVSSGLSQHKSNFCFILTKSLKISMCVKKKCLFTPQQIWFNLEMSIFYWRLTWYEMGPCFIFWKKVWVPPLGGESLEQGCQYNFGFFLYTYKGTCETWKTFFWDQNWLSEQLLRLKN